MDGLTARRPDGRVRPYVVRALILLVAVGPSGRPAAAQVGHDPAHSPYQDILLHSTPSFFFGHLSADRGIAGAGTSNATTFGARFELPAGKALQFQISAAFMHGDRFIIDPSVDSTSPERRTGPFKSDLLLTDLGLQLRLTGGKTWHGLAPYVGTGIGLIFDVDSPGDTTGSGYHFGTKFTVHGTTGVRWYPTRHLSINADVRAQLWRLRYPVSFHTAAPDGSRVVSLDDQLVDWTLHPWISLGVGWTF